MKKSIDLMSYIIMFIVLSLGIVSVTINKDTIKNNSGNDSSVEVEPSDDEQIPIKPKVIEDGKYLIFNSQLKNYLQVDDDDFLNQYLKDQAILELWPYSGEEHQIWEFTHLYSNVYKIISLNSRKALAIPKGSENKRGINLIQEEYIKIPRQHWQIKEVNENEYKIYPLSARTDDEDWVMKASRSGAIDGREVKQYRYTDDDNGLIYGNFSQFYLHLVLKWNMSQNGIKALYPKY